jgi:hypothetical protein
VEKALRPLLTQPLPSSELSQALLSGQTIGALLPRLSAPIVCPMGQARLCGAKIRGDD